MSAACDAFELDLAALRAGALAPERIAEHEAHALSCARCAQVRASDEALDRDLALDLPAGGEDRLAARVDALVTSGPPRAGASVPWAWVAGLSVVVGLVALSDLRRAAPPPTPRPPAKRLGPDAPRDATPSDPRERAGP